MAPGAALFQGMVGFGLEFLRGSRGFRECGRAASVGSSEKFPATAQRCRAERLRWVGTNKNGTNLGEVVAWVRPLVRQIREFIQHRP